MITVIDMWSKSAASSFKQHVIQPLCLQGNRPLPSEDVQSLLWRTKSTAPTQRSEYIYICVCVCVFVSLCLCALIPASLLCPIRKRRSWLSRACWISVGACVDQSGFRCRMTTSESDHPPPPHPGILGVIWTVKGKRTDPVTPLEVNEGRYRLCLVFLMGNNVGFFYVS